MRARWQVVAVLVLILTAGCRSQNTGPRPDVVDDSAAVAIPDPLSIQLTGTEHRWRAEYAAPDGSVAATHDLQVDRRLHVPVDTDVVLILRSTDYIYTLAIPEFGLKEIAVPDLEFRLAFRPTQAGRYALVGEELCGGPGGNEPGQLVVTPRREFLEWVRGKTASEGQ